MSNVSSREKLVRTIEVTVPNPAARRDVWDLLRVADQKYRELHPNDPHIAGDHDLYDDAYMVEFRDDEVVAIIKADPS